VADHDDGLATLLRRGANAFGRGAGGQALVRLGLDAGGPRELLCGLARTEKRARQDRVGPEALVGEALPERAGGFSALGSQRPQLVRLSGGSFGMTHDHQLHGGQHSLRVVRAFRYVVADVFTDTSLEGNPVAVFTDGRGLSDEEMQRLARELNLSESVFVLPSEADAHARIRIFTPSAELPFAGHPTLGSAFVLAAPLQSPVVRLETGMGVVPVALEREQNRIVFGRMEQPLPTWEAFAEEEALFAALGVEGSELPVEVYENGPRFVYVGLGSEDAVAALRPDFNALLDLPGLVGVDCFAGSGARWKSRMFAPGSGVAEDPATGSAAGPLAVHLARHGRIGFGDEIEISQGAEIGRPSTLYARVDGSAEELERVEVGGSAVIVARGEFRLPN
jgi:trans-2,3-dihydro-3-hydroxyanthranilate isomerase